MTNNETFPGFAACVAMMRSPDALTREEGYWRLVEVAPDYVEDLIAVMQAEQNSLLRGEFIDLLGDTRSRAAVPVLVAELQHPDRMIQDRAASSLLELDFPETAVLLKDYQARYPADYACLLQLRAARRQQTGAAHVANTARPLPSSKT